MSSPNAYNVTVLQDIPVGPGVLPAGTSFNADVEWVRDSSYRMVVNGEAAKPDTTLMLPSGQVLQLAALLQAAPRVLLPQAHAAGQGDALLWWPLAENVATASSTPVITDSSGQLSGTYAGGTRRWGAWPGLAFDGASRVPMTGGLRGGFTVAARRCGNLASLVKGVDQVTAWAVVAHPSSISGADRTILSWGATQGAKGGWAVGIGGSRERPYSILAPKGVTDISKCKQEYGLDKITGSAINPTPPVLNTLTAVAFEFMQHGPGYVLGNCFVMPINVDFGVDMRLAGFSSLALVPPGSGGTAAADADVDCPFVLGARATTNNATFTDNLNGMSLLQVGIARHRWNQGLGQCLVRDLRRAPYALPRSLAWNMGV